MYAILIRQVHVLDIMLRHKLRHYLLIAEQIVFSHIYWFIGHNDNDRV